ncbi:insulinase family protein [Candidatus Collierbacteria bacterium]|nr:insulinase family protein [Candidatus Collierbacteria bacterium]
MSFKPKVVELDGLKVVLVKDDRQSVTVQAMIGAGSREEVETEAGAGHFLEHFVFKGTQEFPGMFDINEAVEKVGGAYNAYTGYADMGFWVKTDKDNLPLAAKIVGQLVSKPLLPEKHFSKERGTILEELAMYEDRPDSKAGMEMWKALFKNSNIGRSILGTERSLKEMEISKLTGFMDKWFNKGNMLLGVVGNFSGEKELLKLLEKEFAKIIKGRVRVNDKDKFSFDSKVNGARRLIKRPVEQANMAMGLPGIKLTHPLRYALYLVNYFLGGSTISRLFKEVREKRGWAYSIGSGTESFVDVGAVEIGAGLPKEKFKDAMGLIFEIMWGLGESGKWGVTEEELEVAKQGYKGRVSLNFDKPEKVLGYALHDLMFEGMIYTPDEIKKMVEEVTLREVREVCRLIFNPEKVNLAVVGDYQEMNI